MKKTIEELNCISKKVRRDIIKMIYEAGSGHPGGSLSCVEILVTLYHFEMNLALGEDLKRIDKFVLSKGHAAPAYYSVLSSAGFIEKEELYTLRKHNSRLEGHPTNKIEGIDVSSGSLGQGLSIANGMAMAKKLDKMIGYVYCLLGDGEIEEGQIWEALMSANKYNLNNLIVFIDSNGLQIDGTVENVKKLNNLQEKFISFGMYTQKIDGNNIQEIILAIENAKSQDRPSVIIAKTIKGKGISFMENEYKWHGKSLNYEEYKMAMEELK